MSDGHTLALVSRTADQTVLGDGGCVSVKINSFLNSGNGDI